jgi:chaperone required for assembly of F1-ATPase
MAGPETRAGLSNAGRDGPARCYAAVAIEALGSGFGLRLDDRPLLTPARRRLEVPTRALAELTAAEWQSQPARLAIPGMLITRLINTGLDGVALDLAAVQADVAGYAKTDLLCYRAEAPASLVEAQAQAWDPVLDWASERLQARFVLAAGIVYVAQPEPALRAVSLAVGAYGPIGLAALATITSLTGSVLLALASAQGHLAPCDAWARAHIDEDYQARQWGMDGEAAQRRRRRFGEMEAAYRVLRCLSA